MKMKLIAVLIALMVIVTCLAGFFTVRAEGELVFPKAEESQVDMIHVNGNLSFQLKVDFDTNRIFSRYGVKVFLDGQRIGMIEHGQSFEAILGVSKGVHTLTFEKNDNISVQGNSKFKVTGDSDYSCTIHAYRGCVDIRDELLNGSRIDHEALNKELFIEACRTPDYETVLRYPEQANGKKVRISGRVNQAAEISILSVSLLYISDGNNVWYAVHKREGNEERILPGDYITIYGESMNVSSRILGSGLLTGDWLTTIPMVDAKYVVRSKMFWQ